MQILKVLNLIIIFTFFLYTVDVKAQDELDGTGFSVKTKDNEKGRKKYALLIGVSENKHGNSPLTNPEKDVTEIARNLDRRGGFSDITIINSKTELKEIKNKLSEVIKRLEPDSVFLFYFSGHGIYSKSANGNLLMVYDSDKNNPENTTLSEGYIINLLSQRKASFSNQSQKMDWIFIIDACRITSDAESKTDSQENSLRMGRLYPNLSRFYSSMPGEISQDKSKTNESLSLFTRYFVKSINNIIISQREEEKSKKIDKKKKEQSNKVKEEPIIEEIKDYSLLGADAIENKGNGDRKVSLKEIKRYLEENLKGKNFVPDIYIASDMQDFTLIDLDRGFNPWQYFFQSAIMPGWGVYNYGADYGDRISGKVSVYVSPIYFLGFWGMVGKTLSDHRNYANKQKNFNNTNIIPAQPLGFDTILYNYWNLERKRKALDKATFRYNESLSILLGVYILNLAHSYLVPKLIDSFPVFFAFDFRMYPEIPRWDLDGTRFGPERYASFSLEIRY